MYTDRYMCKYDAAARPLFAAQTLHGVVVSVTVCQASVRWLIQSSILYGLCFPHRV